MDPRQSRVHKTYCSHRSQSIRQFSTLTDEINRNGCLIPFVTFQALEIVNNSKATYEKTAKDIKVKHTAEMTKHKDELMKHKDEMIKTVKKKVETVIDSMNKNLEEKITEVDKVYDPACQKLSIQAETISNYLQKVEKSLHRTNEVMKNSRLQELITQRIIDDEIQMLQNEKPQNLTSFQVQVENPESCMTKLCLYTISIDFAVKCCKYVFMFPL